MRNFLSLVAGWGRLLSAALLLCGLTARAQSVSTDAAVQAIYTYGKLAKPAALPHAVAAAVTNTGLRDITNQQVTLTVGGVNTFTSTKTIALLEVGRTVVVTFDAYPTTFQIGTNLLTVSVPADANNTNNTLLYTQQVTTGRLAQVDPAAPFFREGAGIDGQNPGSVIASKYTVAQPTTLNEAKLTFYGPSASVNFRVLIYDATGPGGRPGALLYTSPSIARPVLNLLTPGPVAVPLPNIAVTGSYYVGVQDGGSAAGFGTYLNLGYQLEQPMRQNTNYYQLPNSTTWSSVTTLPFPLNGRLAFEMGLGSPPACPAPTGLTATALTATSATLAFSAPAAATYTLVYGAVGFNPATAGTAVAVPASPFTLTGLTQNTQYQLYLRAACGGTAGPSEFSEPITITTPPACPAPTNLAVSAITPTTARLSFQGPANAAGCTVVYGAVGFNPATAGTSVPATASPVTLTGLQSLSTYDVYVRTTCGAAGASALTGPVKVKTLCIPAVITALPYKEDFDSTLPEELPCGMTVLNNNRDDRTWQLVAGTNIIPAASAPNLMRYVWSADSIADDWLFTPAIAMQAGYRYNLEFKYATSGIGNGGERMNVWFGPAPTVAGQTTQVWDNKSIMNISYLTVTSGTSPGRALPIVPTSSGNYYIGFHVYTPANQYVMMLDDLVLTRTILTATQSPVLDRGLQVYPNPSQGRFTLAVRGVAASGPQRLEVHNTLGQVVYAGLYQSEIARELDLSHLSKGLYLLKVLNGEEFTTRRLLIN